MRIDQSRLPDMTLSPNMSRRYTGNRAAQVGDAGDKCSGMVMVLVFGDSSMNIITICSFLYTVRGRIESPRAGFVMPSGKAAI